MAHMIQIVPPTCGKCGGHAKVRIFGNRNEDLGAYCKSCGKRRLKERESFERDEARRRIEQDVSARQS